MNRGFTLIELLIVISIIAVLSAIGLTIFSGIQSKARDSVRKNDLQKVATALEVYYQKNSRYPCTDNYPFPTFLLDSSRDGGFWIDDDSVPGYNCGSQRFDVTYINQMPQDPQQNSFTVLYNTAARGYGYWSGNGSSLGCSENPGQNYILFTRLENTGDPDRHEIVRYKGCDNTIDIVSYTDTRFKQLYFLTSWK